MTLVSEKLIRLAAWLFACAFLPSVATADVITYYHYDLLASPIVATDQTGAVVWRETFVPYGERMSPTLKPNKVWYTSRFQDDDTRLVYMGARHYDPVTGRFLSTDSVHFDEKNTHTFNRYAYAANNPYRYRDPDGRTFVDAGFAVWDGGNLLGAFTAWGIGTLTNNNSLQHIGAEGIREQRLDFAASTGAIFLPVSSGVLKSGVRIVEQDGNTVRAIIDVAKGQAEVIAEVVREGERITLKGAHIAGEGTLKEVLQAAKEWGREQGAKEIVIEGGKRTTGAKPGHIPRPIEIQTGL